MWNYINHISETSNSLSLGTKRLCPICDSNKSKTILELENFQFYTDSETHPKQFSVRENICLECFALYLNPVYSDYGFNVLFSEAGQSYGVLDAHISEQIQWLDSRKMIEKNFSVLDVGCYEGSFLSKLPKHIKKYGVDIDEPAINRARDKYAKDGSEFFHGKFESFDFKGDAPDTIVMFHVLEHVADPVNVLKKLKQISKKSTNLIVEVPILESGKTNDINGFFSIQHSTHFSKNSLKNCLLKSGWRITEECSMNDYNGFRVHSIPDEEEQIDKKYNSDKKDWYLHLDYLSSWHKSLRDVEEKIHNFKDLPFYVIWGGGAHTEFLYQTTSFFHMKTDNQYIIVDSDTSKHNKTWRGIKIFDPNVLKNFNCNDKGLIISSYSSQNQIKKAALKMGIREEHILCMYDNVVRY